MTSDQLKAELRNYTGCEQPFFNPFYRWMNYTDGVKAFAEGAGAYWFLDYVGFNLNVMASKHPFILLELDVRKEFAKIRFTDGNDEAIRVPYHITYTDCPIGTWKFYLIDGMLLLPSEY